MADILDDLCDLHKQATTERSHYYVAGVAKRAIVEIAVLRSRIDELEQMVPAPAPDSSR